MDSEKYINDIIAEYRMTVSEGHCELIQSQSQGLSTRLHKVGTGDIDPWSSQHSLPGPSDLALFPCATAGEVTVIR